MFNNEQESRSIILRNKLLEPIEDKETGELITRLMKETSDYLMSISSPENKKVIQERLPHIDVVLMDQFEDTAYMKINGKLSNFVFYDANAFATDGKTDIINGRIFSDYYMYLKKHNSEHIIKHEIMHVLSATRETKGEPDNVYVVKNGLRRWYEIAREEDLLDRDSLYSDGECINEGMTDYLTFLSEKTEIQDYNYIINLLLAKFLVGANIENENNLIQAYVSDSVESIEGFEKEFNSCMQDEGIKYEDYGQFEECFDLKDYSKLLKGAISYRVKTAKTVDERNNELNFYKTAVADIKDDKKLNKELKCILKNDLKPMISELKKHIKSLTIEKEQDNDFDITTQSIGEATVSSPTNLKQEVKNIERKLTAREKTFKNKGVEYND